jgi:hypothetical protein
VAVILLLLACAVRAPVPLFEPPPPLPELARPRVEVPPGACRGEPVDPGVALDCTGIAISVEHSEAVEVLRADFALVVDRLAEERRARLQDRAIAELLVVDARQRARDAESDARALRVAVPVALVGGALLTVGALWAADEALR